MPDARPYLVSVGNLVAGGTGKTPVVMDLARRLTAAGLRTAVLTRGHGGRAAGPLRVRPDDRDCGDEARLLAAALPAVPVVQARRRRRGLDFLLREAPGCDIVLLEDAHQTAGVPRHLDVLILDRWERRAGVVVPTPVRRLPWGPGREAVAGAARARLWLVEAAADLDGAPARPRGCRRAGLRAARGLGRRGVSRAWRALRRGVGHRAAGTVRGGLRPAVRRAPGAGGALRRPRALRPAAGRAAAGRGIAARCGLLADHGQGSC
ncbi:MAG: tetraacyldisaccharide 4'-kinase [bacterium]|nr:tetraacyldisaccharide 4'-kinase [bacterium]